MHLVVSIILMSTIKEHRRVGTNHIAASLVE